MKTTKNNLSLEDIAHQIMLDKGFLPDFPEEVKLQEETINSPGKSMNISKDMTHLLWISIDNDDSKDLDQLTYAENISPTTDKIYIAIADVDSLVKKGSPIDLYASHNTTSVYTPTRVFSMLPLKLSTNLTSLNENEVRCAIVTEVDVEKNGKFTLSDIYPAIVKNQAKLKYNATSEWLEGKTPIPEKENLIPNFSRQIHLQDAIAQRIKSYRLSLGALTFKTTQLTPVIKNGMPVQLTELEINRARLLIENFMIAANVAMTHYMKARNMSILRRVVRTPKRWDRIVNLAQEYHYELPVTPDPLALQKFLSSRFEADPDQFPELSLTIIKLIGRGEYVLTAPNETIGHFDLALTDYSHTTAPNRRYPDLVTQRLIKSSLNREPSPYTQEELLEIAKNCTQKEDDSAKVERRVLKSAAAMVLENQIGSYFEAMVTGVNENGTWIRLINPPIEGKLVHGFDGMDVGDRVKVKLIHVDVYNGYIDFTKA